MGVAKLRAPDGSAALWRGDMRDIIAQLPEVDAVITDPPYGETSLAWDRWPDGWLELLVGKTHQIWCFASLRMLWEKQQQFAAWKLAQEIVWEKPNGSGLRNDRFRRVHELALHIYRGKWSALYKRTPRVTVEGLRSSGRVKLSSGLAHYGTVAGVPYEYGNTRIMRSVIKVPSCHRYAEHPTQKPEELIRPLIEYSVPPGGIVLDPFMGSGSTGAACLATGRRFIGIERDPAYFDIACRRLLLPLAVAA